MKKSKKLPPCPDPELFDAVLGKTGWYWRKKRGTVKEAPVNAALQYIADNAKYSMPAAQELIKKLEPFTEGFGIRMHTSRFSSFFTRSKKEEGKMSWSVFRDYEFNEDCMLNKLLLTKYKLTAEKDTCSVMIPVRHDMLENGRNRKVTGVTFELILLSGDPAKPKTLRTESDLSEEYAITHSVRSDAKPPAPCTLSLQLPPRKPYMILLRVNCREGRFSAGVKQTALKVLMVN